MEFFSTKEITEFAIKIETNGYKFYQTASLNKKISEEARLFFKKLMNDEAKHKTTFEQMRSNFDSISIKNDKDWEEISEYIELKVKLDIFNKSEKAINLATQAQKKDEIVKYALEFEVETIEFFRAIKDFVTDKKTTKMIDKIISEEETHIEILKGF